MKTKDLTNSGKIQVSKMTQISGELNNSGSVASVNKVTVTKDVKNTGEISTNDDFLNVSFQMQDYKMKRKVNQILHRDFVFRLVCKV